MKRILFSLALLTANLYLISNDATMALEPNITDEQKWQEYEKKRLTTKGLWQDFKEYSSELIEDIKHSPLLDILFFKKNKVETEFAQNILKKFDLDLNQVTILHKHMYGTPAATIFNTILVDHHKMSKFTPEEQAFILGHEIIHLKNKDWLTRMGIALPLELFIHLLLSHIKANTISSMTAPGQEVSGSTTLIATVTYWQSWLIFELYFKAPLMAYISRYQEKRCDIESAKTLKLAAAGASAFEKMRKKWICKQESTFNPSNIIYKILDGFGIFHTHPALYDRSEYLQALADEQAAELA